MKLAFAIATITALQQADVARADCDFGSNYTRYWNDSSYCPFEVAVGTITLSLSSTSNTTSSGDTNVTTYDEANLAIWKVGDKESTVQCFPNITADVIETAYPNGSMLTVFTGDFYSGLASTDTVADGVPLSFPGLYYFKGGLVEVWSDKDDNRNITDAEGDITNLCEVLGGGAAPAPTPTSPTTEAPAPATDSSVGDSTVGTITEDSDGNIVGSYGEGAYGEVDIEHSTETFYNSGKVATLARTTTAAFLSVQPPLPQCKKCSTSPLPFSS